MEHRKGSLEPTAQKRTPLRVMTVLDMPANKFGGMEEYLIRLSRELKDCGGQSLIVVRTCNEKVRTTMSDCPPQSFNSRLSRIKYSSMPPNLLAGMSKTVITRSGVLF